MFQARFSFSLSRLFRFCRRRDPKSDASGAAPAPLASKALSERPVSQHPSILVSQLERPHAALASLPVPIQSPPTPVTPPIPLIIIGSPDLEPLPLPPAPAPPADFGPRIPVDGVLLVDAPPSRRVSFQVPSTIPEDPPSSPLSTCSTLVSETEPEAVQGEAQAQAEPRLQVAAEAEAETEAPAVTEQPRTCEADLGSTGATETETLDTLPLPLVERSGTKARHISLFGPQPVRLNFSRFSLPAKPRTLGVADNENVRNGRRESRRTSVMSPTSGATKKEKRTTRWSRELNKPETQEVLRVLRGL